jgi:hypothetical protein
MKIRLLKFIKKTYSLTRSVNVMISDVLSIFSTLRRQNQVEYASPVADICRWNGKLAALMSF